MKNNTVRGGDTCYSLFVLRVNLDLLPNLTELHVALRVMTCSSNWLLLSALSSKVIQNRQAWVGGELVEGGGANRWGGKLNQEASL